MLQKSWSWFVPHTNVNTVRMLAETLGINELTAAALYQRGLHTPQDAKQFLACDLADLGDPFSMADAERAAARLAAAVRAKEKVLVFGDYDVDGLTATALLVLVLQELAVPVEYYIPSRFADGYGLQAEVLKKFAAAGGRLVVTVDCGINSFAEMEEAKALGLDLIITDHHTCFAGERPAFAVLNPKQEHCRYPEKHLAGVGVAWTLVRALYKQLHLAKEEAYRYLDLVAVGTVADVVPLLGENRILVKHGLQVLQDNPLPGLAALVRTSGLKETQIGTREIAFALAPRLNAAGRLGEAEPAMQVLLASPETADLLAQELNALNRQRQEKEKDILWQAQQLAAEQANEPALVLWQEGWNPGIIGIVAGRLAMEYKRPVALITVNEHEGRGSIRTSAGYNVIEALQKCADYLEKYGGHQEAAGFTVAPQRLAQFKQAFCQAIATQEPKAEALPVVAEVSLCELTEELATELTALAPYGYGHPEPLFWVRRAQISSARQVGMQGEHLRLWLTSENAATAAIYFGGGREQYKPGDVLELIVAAGLNCWQGKTSLSLHIKDARRQTQDIPLVDDRRHCKQKEQYIAALAAKKKVAVWVNTKAAKLGLEQLLGPKVFVTHLGRHLPGEKVDALLLYHIPYDRDAFEKMLTLLKFTGTKHLILCYTQDDADLNEKIFAATVPEKETFLQLANFWQHESSLENAVKRMCHALNLPVTRYLLAQIQAVLQELAVSKTDLSTLPQRLNQSAIYRKHLQALKQFRAYQDFWLQARPGEVVSYLLNPQELILEEEEGQADDSSHIKGTNQNLLSGGT
ncbi:MAG: single-stranded-DNA-specific exonuclease RecJ [Firmicutes bacterium]|nr:single-stranded-DNA-specific exonuclease RecJ [Bacillota bacterium]